METIVLLLLSLRSYNYKFFFSNKFILFVYNNIQIKIMCKNCGAIWNTNLGIAEVQKLRKIVIAVEVLVSGEGVSFKQCFTANFKMMELDG